MEYSEKYNFYLPSRDGEDIVDINQISDNFRIIDENIPSKKDLDDFEPSINEERLVGRKTTEGGEIFNDYENNKAISLYSTAKGTNTIAGGKGFKILSIAKVTDTEGVACNIVLDSVVGLEVSMVCSATITLAYTDFAKIVSIDATTNTIAIDTYPEGATVNSESVLYIGTLAAQQSGIGTTIIGAFQSAEGDETVAIHESAHAEGRQTVANGKYSHAEGRKTKSGYAAHAEGYETSALGQNSHTEGQLTKATALEAHAEGYKTTASARGAHSEGGATRASGGYAHAEGSSTKALHDYSHSAGWYTETGAIAQTVVGKYNTVSNDSLFVVGNGIDENNKKNALEVKVDGSAILQTQGTDDNSVVIKATLDSSVAKKPGKTVTSDNSGEIFNDYKNNSAQYFAHAEGENTTANGYGSHSEGRLTTASGESSHSEGYNTTSSGRAAHSEGVNGTTASGVAAHAEGITTKAIHDGSHSSGEQTRTGRNNQTVVGEWNKVVEYALFVVGNGEFEENRKNAFEVKADGSAEVQIQGNTDNSVVIKSYVDNLCGDIETALDSIIAIQEGMIGGGSE